MRGVGQGINYLAIDFQKNQQIGSNKKDTGKLDLSDGLSQSELMMIDKNGDGVVTEKEFKEAFKKTNKHKNYKKAWDQYAEACQLTSRKTKRGTQVTQTVNGKTTVTNLDKKGRKINSATNRAGGSFGYTKGAGGVAASTNERGDVNEVSTKQCDVSLIYDSRGNVRGASVRIGNKLVKGSDVSIKRGDDGKTTVTVRNKRGKVIAQVVKDAKGNQTVTAFKNGRKFQSVQIDANGFPKKVSTYNKGGAKIKEYDCRTGKSKKAEYYADGSRNITDSDGNITHRTRYGIESTIDKEGKLTRAVTDNSQVKLSYDSHGNVKGARVTVDGKTVVTNNVTTRQLSEDEKEAIIRDNNGQIIAKVNFYNDDETGEEATVTTYKDGKKYESVTFDMCVNMASPSSYTKYNKDGKKSKFIDCDNEKVTKFRYNKKGFLIGKLTNKTKTKTGRLQNGQPVSVTKGVKGRAKGKLTDVNTKESGVSLKYDSRGNIKSASVRITYTDPEDGSETEEITEASNITVKKLKDGSTVTILKDEDGKTLAKIKKDRTGAQNVTTFKDGKPYQSISISKNGEPKKVKEYEYGLNGNLFSTSTSLVD